MRKIVILLFCCAAMIACAGPSKSEFFVHLPDCIRVNGGKFHVQGLAYDEQAQCMYFSFTSAFFKSDMKGNVIASIADINGHIGAMTFDGKNRRVIASLEMKDDIIGRNIARKLGQEAWLREQAGFYLAVIDVDRLTRMNMKQEEVMTLVRLEEVCNDYRAEVNVGDKALEHRFACSGIDGVTIGPAFGAQDCGAEVETDGNACNCESISGARNSGKQQRYVYVAYGVYGDTIRTDNDYNVLLAYGLEDVLANAGMDSSPNSEVCLPSASSSDSCAYKTSDYYESRQLVPVHKYFVHTGNTEWGVQNLAYDSSTDQMFLAVYKGSKSRWPNYDLFALNMNQQAAYAVLEGVPYHSSVVEQLEVSGAWRFKWGSTGLCPLGEGLYFISHNGASNGSNYCEARLYRWQGSSSPDGAPFVPAADTQAGAK